MENLDQTPVPPAPLPTLETGRRLGRILGQRDFILRAWAFVAGSSLILNLAMSVLLLVVLQKGTQVFGITEGGIVLQGEGVPIDRSIELQTNTAALATAAMLNRGPEQLDFPGFVTSLFSRKAQDLVDQLRRNEQAEFAQREWRQKAELHQIDILDVRGSSVEILVSGFLLRSGPFAGQPLDHVIPFQLHLTLVRNPDLLRGSRYPLLVVSFKLTYEKS